MFVCSCARLLFRSLLCDVCLCAMYVCVRARSSVCLHAFDNECVCVCVCLCVCVVCVCLVVRLFVWLCVCASVGGCAFNCLCGCVRA